MTGRDSYLDRVIDWGLAALLVFTPLAFGAVEPWAQAIAQLTVMVVFAAWVLQLTWSPGVPRPALERSLFGGRMLLSGLEWPALLFCLVVLLQLVPLPPAAVRAASPRTAELFASALPGYGTPGEHSFRDLPAWLQNDPEPEAGGVPALPPDAEKTGQALAAESFDVAHPAWRPLSLTPAKSRRALQFFLAHCVIFLIAFDRFGERKRGMRFVYLLCVLAGLLALLGILQGFTAGQRIYWMRPGVGGLSFGPFVSRNNYAGWMEMVLPVAAGLTLTLWGRSRGASRHLLDRGGRTPAAVVILGFTTLIGLAAFVLSRSRGGVLALGGAVLIYAAVQLPRGGFGWRKLAVVVLVIAVVLSLVAWIGGAEVWERYAAIGALDKEPSMQFRLRAAAQTVGMALEFPLLGTGLGTFAEAYALYSPGTSDKMLRRAHNDYAQVLAECGLLGGLAVLWALLLLVRRGLGPGLSRRGSPHRWVVRGIAVGVLALLLHSFVDFNLQIYSNSVLFVMLCAFLLRDGQGQRRRRGRRNA